MQKFEKIHNFRKVTEKLPIYRSANWDKATKSDLEKMYNEYKVRYRVDLRSPVEVWYSSRSGHEEVTPAESIAANLKVSAAFKRHKPVTEQKFSGSRAQQLKAIRNGNVGEAAEASSQKNDIVWHGTFTGSEDTDIEIEFYNVNFMNFEYIQEVVWNRLTWRERFRLVGWLLLGRTSKVAEYIGKNILSTGGLLGMYKDFVDSSGDAINAALTAISEFLGKVHGGDEFVSMGCFLGRDRSGIISAFLQHLAGDDLETVAHSYSHSEDGLKDMLHEMDSMNQRQGLGSDFNGAPKEVMLQFFAYLDEKYGGVESYLESIGFGAEKQERIRSYSLE